jgi:hypothetical protein
MDILKIEYKGVTASVDFESETYHCQEGIDGRVKKELNMIIYCIIQQHRQTGNTPSVEEAKRRAAKMLIGAHQCGFPYFLDSSYLAKDLDVTEEFVLYRLGLEAQKN